MKKRQSHSNPTQLSVPTWVPAAVAAQAREVYAHLALMPPDVTDKFATATKRLATDRRMQSVWSELDSRVGGRERNEGFVHPVRPTAVRQDENTSAAGVLLKALPRQERLQQQAMVNVFSNAVGCFWWDRAGPGPRTRAKASADAEVRGLEALALHLRQGAAQLRRLRGSRFAPALDQAAAYYDLQADLARAANRSDPFIVQRHSDRLGDDWVRGFIIEMAGHFKALFGKRMIGLVAVMANVAFERTDLTENKVRGVFRRRHRPAP